MSDESISFGEDKENLLYISRKINIDEFGLGEDGPFRESVSTADSDLSARPEGSEVSFLNTLESIPEIFSDPQVVNRFKSFDLVWTYGLNDKVGVLNLTNDTRKDLFFSSVHFGIIYNYCTKEMARLEGHQYVINCISSDRNGEWLVTSDGDKNGCLIVWSSKELAPVLTLFSIYEESSGILLMAISPCARYLVTIGERIPGNYSVDLWLWTHGDNKPNDSYSVSSINGEPVKICFNPDVEEHIMLVFERQVFLIMWDAKAKKIVHGPIPAITAKNKVGELTCGTYMDKCHECYASSSKGYVLVFRNTLYGRDYEDAELNNSKMYINSIKVTHASIGVITATEGILVVGDSKGHIVFFDKRVKVLYWIKNPSLGSICSISFALIPKVYQYEDSKIVVQEKEFEDNILDCDLQNREEEIAKLIEVPFDATLQNRSFTLGDFFVCTSDCNIYAFDFIRNQCTSLFQKADAFISAIDAHDEKPYIVIGYANGRMKLINFDKKEKISTYVLPKTEETEIDGDVITCIKYSHQSLHLVCGRANGDIWVLEPVILVPKSENPLKHSSEKIVKIDFSYNSLQFAYYDNKKTVGLYNYDVENSTWQFCGKIRAHYSDIKDMRFFCTQNDATLSTLYTIGADRYLVEYNNIKVGNDQDEEFAITMRERIEQSAIPQNFTFYEKIWENKTVGYILLADDKHKIKTLHATTKVPRTLVLGPSFGCFKNTHIRKMVVLPNNEGRFMIFMTERHIGIHLLPLDGNPYKYTGYLGHPEKIQDFVLSHDGRYAFTFGVEDKCILQWKIKARSVELLTLMGGRELEPYYCLLEGGKNGWLFQEIQDLFFYMQILQQENIDLPRRVSDGVGLSDIPDLVRTCGFYPSNFEIESMMLDIRYRDFDETGIVKDEITFVDFVKLFINHRPVYGYTMQQITDAFKTLCGMADYPKRSRIENTDFVYVLQNIGEPSPNLHKDLTTLLRISTYGENNFDFLPPDITTHFLFYELLGIDPGSSVVADDEPETEEIEQTEPYWHY